MYCSLLKGKWYYKVSKRMRALVIQSFRNWLIYFLILLNRCSLCENQRRKLIDLQSTLIEAGLDKVVVGEADCCQETELCKSSDRKTMCLPESIIQGSTVLIRNSFGKIRIYFSFHWKLHDIIFHAYLNSRKRYLEPSRT